MPTALSPAVDTGGEASPGRQEDAAAEVAAPTEAEAAAYSAGDWARPPGPSEDHPVAADSTSESLSDGQLEA
eukprot:15430919-Alexandrium_andersonii.AAC.1